MIRSLQKFRDAWTVSSRERRLRSAINRHFDPKMIDPVREELVLPSKTADFTDAPPCIFVLLFNSRAGSTYAGRLLSNTPQFEHVSESFNVGQLAAIRERYDYPDDSRALRWMIEDRGTDQAFGVKSGPAGIAAATFTGFLPQLLERTQFIMLERRDKLAQAVSKYKLTLTNVAQTTDGPPERIVVSKDYDRAAIDAQLDAIERGNRRLRDFVSAIGAEAPTFYYEDVCASPKTFVNDVLALLGFEPVQTFDTETDVQKIGDAINAEWIERYRNGD